MRRWMIVVQAFLVLVSFGQQPFERMVLDTLCHSVMEGRGYYNQGDSIAAEYLIAQYKELGVLPVNDNGYTQSFKHPVNHLNGKLKLKLGKEELIPGEDYLIDPSSPSVSGKGEVVELSTSVLLDSMKIGPFIRSAVDKWIMIDAAAFQAAGIYGDVIQLFRKYELGVNGLLVVQVSDLIFTAKSFTAKQPIIYCKKEAWEANKSGKVKLIVDSEYDVNYHSRNIVGKVEGVNKDSTVYIVAHYDHLGRMGDDVYFPGANDNASGVAMLLTLAKHYASSSEPPPYTMVFVAFAAEEIGLVGSKYYVENALTPLEDIRFLINLDILGTGEDGIQIVNSAIHKKEYELMDGINRRKQFLKQIKLRGERCNSDHCYFHMAGVPSFFIYTLGGIAHYHNIWDKAETLPLNEFPDLKLLLVEFIQSL